VKGEMEMIIIKKKRKEKEIIKETKLFLLFFISL